MKFTTPRIVATEGVMAWQEGNVGRATFIQNSLSRHFNGDWGEVDGSDKKKNDESLKERGYMLSAYTFEGTKIWIITDVGWEVTTVLFPSEY